MNYYITNVMEEYTPDMDQMLFYLPLAGSTFKKTYFDETLGRAVSKFVPVENLVVPYETADLETCPNITQVVRMSLNDLRKRQIAGVYLDVDVLPAQKEISEVTGNLTVSKALSRIRLTTIARFLNVTWTWTLRGTKTPTKTANLRGSKSLT